MEQADADQLRRYVHVAHRHPHPPDAAVDDVRGDPGHHGDDGQHDEIAGRGRGFGAGDRQAEQVCVGTSIAPDVL